MPTKDDDFEEQMTPEQARLLARLTRASEQNVSQQLARAAEAMRTDAPTAKLREWIRAARTAHGVVEHVPLGLETPSWSIRKPATAGGQINLNRQTLPGLFDAEGKLRRSPNAKLAASQIRLPTAILQESRVAAAGAHVIIQSDPTRAVPTGSTGVVVLERVPTEFRTVESANFLPVADGADVAVSTLPALSAPIDWDTSVQRGVRMEFSRRQQKALDEDVFASEIMTSITLALARAADAALLAAITATTPAPFTLAAAAAQGLRFAELTALIGTAGRGAMVDQAGRLTAGGVTAELTGDMAGTIVGGWDRAAIAIHENVPLLFERLNRQGDLAVTAWVNLIPLVPDKARFWVLPA
jgi:hypothetical protein